MPGILAFHGHDLNLKLTSWSASRVQRQPHFLMQNPSPHSAAISTRERERDWAPHPVGRLLLLGLPLIQLGFGLGVHLHQQVLVSNLQVVEQPQGAQCRLRLLVLAEPKRWAERVWWKDVSKRQIEEEEEAEAKCLPPSVINQANKWTT